MKVSRKLFGIIATLTLLTLTAMFNLAEAQGITSIVATAPGQGKLTVGAEVFKVSNVIVKLNEDGTGEITLITDLQLLVKCTWSATENLNKGIDLKITAGGASAQGSGKLFLRADGKAIASLSMDGTSNTKRKIQLKFVAD